jgi:hypothetical protein
MLGWTPSTEKGATNGASALAEPGDSSRPSGVRRACRDRRSRRESPATDAGRLRDDLQRTADRAVRDQRRCWFAHLGPATYGAIQTVVPNADGTVHITVTGTYICGERRHPELVGVGTGSFTGPGTVHYETTETYSGESGRFVDATGMANDVGDANLATATSSFASSGWIAY